MLLLENNSTWTESFDFESFLGDDFNISAVGNCTNVTECSEFSPGTPKLNIPYAVMEALVAIVAVIGNALVIIVFHRERRLRRRTNYYIISLALADFLVGLLGIPFAILASIGLPKNLYACLLTTSSLVVLCTISIFCLVAVSIDRYWAILHPLAYSRNVRTKTAIGIISLCWLFGSIIGFLPVFGWHNDTTHNEQCFFTEIMDYNYLVFLYFVTIITPSVILVVFYGLIYRVILKQVNKTSSSIMVIPSSTNSTINSSNIQHSSETQMLRLLNSAAQKREVKATQNLSIIVAFFMICWIPLYTINCVNAFCKECFIYDSVIFFSIILSHLNSAINPLLYAYHLKDFRGALYRLLTCQSNDPETFYRRSLVSQRLSQNQQQRTISQLNQRRSLQQRVYIDSPIWQRQQMPLEPVNKARTSQEGSGFGKWERDHSKSPSADTQHSPTLKRNHSSQSNKIFIISDAHAMETEISCQPQSSSLYRIVNKRQETNCF